MCGTKLKFSTAFHPQTDGQSERTNRTMEEVLRAFTHPRQDDWDLHLSMCEFAINNSISPSTGTTPFYANYARNPITPIDLSIPALASVPAATELKDHLTDIVATVKARLQEAQERQTHYANLRRRDISYSVGDLVLLSTAHLKLPQSLTPKFKPRFIGPYRIEKQISPVSYLLKLPATLRIHPVFHVSLFRDYHPRGTPREEVQVAQPLFENDNQWEVDRLLGKRTRGRGAQYLVRWVGLGPEHDEWVARLNIHPSIVQAFEHSAS
jgi:hypothetical protein